MACGIQFPGQRTNPGPLCWELRVLAPGSLRSPGKGRLKRLAVMSARLIWCELGALRPHSTTSPDALREHITLYVMGQAVDIRGRRGDCPPGSVLGRYSLPGTSSLLHLHHTHSTSNAEHVGFFPPHTTQLSVTPTGCPTLCFNSDNNQSWHRRVPAPVPLQQVKGSVP